MDVYTADPDRDGRPGALVASGVVIRKPGFGWLVEIGDDAIEWVACDLETRLQCLPVGRIRHMSDYWELRSVEEDHVRGLARRYSLPDQECEALEAHWLARIDATLEDKVDSFRFEDIDAMRHSRIARHLRGSNFAFQVWFNTVGPGTRTWFGNRATWRTVRRFMFRLHWGP